MHPQGYRSVWQSQADEVRFKEIEEGSVDSCVKHIFGGEEWKILAIVAL